MAKKKSSQKLTQTLPMAAPIDDSFTQIQNLKSLNAVLVKETAQSRQHIDSLRSALHRSAVTYDVNAAFDIQNSVVSVFVENMLVEMNLRLLRDKECEAKRLRESVDRERREAERLSLQGQELLSQKQRRVEELTADRDLAVRSSQESLKVMEALKEEIEAVSREKDGYQNRSNAQRNKIAALEVELEQLKYLRKEEEVLRAKVLQLEGDLGRALRKEEDMKMEISALVREKKDMEWSVEILTKEKNSVGKALTVIQKELNDTHHELDEVVRARGQMEEAVVNLQNGVAELQGKVDELQESCGKLEEENKQLDTQVKRYKNAVDEAVLEKESIRKVVDGERQKVEKLESLVISTQKVVEKSDAELGKVRSEREKLVEKEKVMQGKVDELKESFGKLEEENKQLHTQVKRYKNAVDEAVLEKENIRKVVDGERQKVETLESLVASTQKVVEKSDAELGKVRSEREKLVEKEKVMQGKVDEFKEYNGKLEEENRQLYTQVKLYRNAVDEAVLEKESIRKVVDEERQKVEKLESLVASTLKVVEESDAELGKVRSEREKLVEKEKVMQGIVDELKESYGKLEEVNKQLHTQVKLYKKAVDEAVLEKESIREVVDGERQKVEKLESLVASTQKVVEKSDAELGKVRSEREKLVEKEKVLEGNVNVLRKENDALQSKLAEARRESEDLNAKVDVWCTNSNKALALLKTTAAALVCQQRDRGEEVVSNENHVEEIQPYAQELEAIKKAFKSKDEMVDDMKQQLVSLNKSVVEAHKSKSLLTVISSATTIFAAVLAAYFARGR